MKDRILNAKIAVLVFAVMVFGLHLASIGGTDEDGSINAHFHDESTTRSVAENTTAGNPIGNPVTAHNFDSAAHEYTLNGPDADSFAIDDDTGQLETWAKLDFETRNSYEVTVSVEERGPVVEGEFTWVTRASIDVTIMVTNRDDPDPPVFDEDAPIQRSVAENTAPDVNIGDPISATDVNAGDTLTYSIENTIVTDSDPPIAISNVFSIDSETGQLKTKGTLDYEAVSSYSVQVSVSDGTNTVIVWVEISIENVSEIVNMSSRTPQVRDAIVAAISDVDDSADVTEKHLEAITSLDVSWKKITDLKLGDFEGLLALETLQLYGNRLSSLPADIFDGLPAIKKINLSTNRLSSLDENIFDGLTSLEELYLFENKLSSLDENIFEDLSSLEILLLYSNKLSSLDPDLFDGLTSLETLNVRSNSLSSLDENIFEDLSALQYLVLNANDLSSLPPDIFDGLSSLKHLKLLSNDLSSLDPTLFDGLSSLEVLYLHANDLSSLPPDIFDGLSSLEKLLMDNNDLSSLPPGIFDGLSSLEKLTLQENAVDPLPVTVSLEKVGDNQFKAVVPVGAPFEMVLPVSITGGTIDTEATSLTVSTGSTESDPLTVNKESGQDAVVDLGEFPGFPPNSGHEGYSFVKSADVPLTVIKNSTPVFDAGELIERYIAENTAADENIGDPITATDGDGDTLTYSVSGVLADRVTIDTATGQLKTKAALDFETSPVFAVLVSVSDGTHTEDTAVRIHITNVNEAPVFSSETIRLTVSDDLSEDENVGDSISAVDPDITPANADANPETTDTVDTLSYTLDGTDESSFSIDNTGQLTASEALFEDEDRTSYELTVSVSDGSLTSSVDVIIAPESGSLAFEEGETATRSVPENTLADVAIGDVLAISMTPADPPYTYSLGGMAARAFEIEAVDSETEVGGQLKTHDPLDYELLSTFTVEVSVSSASEETATIEVTVNVENVNEAPAFPDNASTRSVVEGLVVGSAVGNPIGAADPDIHSESLLEILGIEETEEDSEEEDPVDTNPETEAEDALVYSLSGTDASSFTIDSATGQLRTNAVFDFDVKSSYTVTVGVSDGSLTDSVDVTITVTEGDTPVAAEIETTVESSADSDDEEEEEEETVVVSVSDTNLAAVLRESLSLAEDADITSADLQTLTELDAAESEISDLTGLEYATNLESLDLSDNSISDITALSGLTALETLYLDTNSIDDITALSGLTDLESLSLAENSISDLGALASLKNLTMLMLNDNLVSELGTLDELTKLNELYLENNLVKDISNLAALTELHALELGDNSVSKIGDLSALTELWLLDLSDNSMSDISDVLKLTALEHLNLSSNSITKIGNMSRLSKLEHLDLSSNLITKPDGLSELLHLRHLDLSSNSISDLSLLAELTDLVVLYLSSNSIGDIHPLARLTDLELLDLSENSISNIGPLTVLTDLEALYLEGNSILDTSPLWSLLVQNGGNLLVDIEVSEYPPWDVNEDGSVDAKDSALVTAALGQDGEDIVDPRTDVNGDGTVDNADVLLVTQNLDPEDEDAAPSALNLLVETLLDPKVLQTLDPATLEAHLMDLRAESDGSLKYIRAIALLERVLAALRPAETALLANYPNPFNPETWIPYHLANPSRVEITIYNTQGSVVRRLDLGHQREGYYTNRSRAAYWDGRNNVGERVASGIYFYQFQADNVSLLRKMVILK